MRKVIHHYLEKIRLQLLKKNKSSEYLNYLNQQYNRSKDKFEDSSTIKIQNKRKEVLIDILAKKINLKKIKNALVIGCRDSYELDLLEKKGVYKTTGIDLFSSDKRIKVMDMHELNFKDNQFDLIYCSHVLEHSFNYHNAIKEIVRVIKGGGVLVIEVPVNYKPIGSDLHDFKNSKKLIKIISGIIKIEKIIYKKDVSKNMKDNFSNTDVTRLIIKIKNEKDFGERNKNKYWKKIEDKLIQYYTKCYRDSLGIPNYYHFVEARLAEDQNFIHIFRRIKALIPFFYLSAKDQKVLVIGAGTGAELINFIKMGYNAYGIEPNSEAFKIVQLKLDYYRMNKNRIKKSVAEKLPFPNNYFQMVWSWTVLEHVKDVEKTLKEIYRVLKPDGWAFLTMPDTRQFWEGHYKMYLPMFLPRFFLKLILKLKKRPTRFLSEEINKINVDKVRNILQHSNFDSLLLFHPWSDEWKTKRNFGMNLIYWTTVISGRQRDQWWLLHKN